MSSNNNCNRSYEPYMLGTSYGVGVSPSAPNMSRQRQNQSVRDCLLWSESTPAAPTGYSSYSNYGIPTGGACSGVIAPSSSVGRLQTPKAFLAGLGQGAGEGQPMNIPCQIAPLGTNPQSLIQPMNPVTVKVTAPRPPPGSSGPMTFTLNPQDIYRAVL